jgi:hypothetical protein
MDGICSMRRENEICTKFLTENLKVKLPHGICRVIYNWILKKKGIKAQTRFKWLRI